MEFDSFMGFGATLNEIDVSKRLKKISRGSQAIIRELTEKATSKLMRR